MPRGLTQPAPTATEKKMPPEQSMILLLRYTSRSLSHSALPHSPVIPDPQPSRLHTSIVRRLHRLANRLERGP